MGNSGSAGYRARRRELEQRRRQQAQRAQAKAARSAAPGVEPGGRGRRTEATCGWCGGPITVRSRGPIPKWCSPTCRHRAWEQSRAAASGRAAVQVVERRVEVPTPVVPTRRDWPGMLGELVRQLDGGHIYDRDLSDLAVVLRQVLEAHHRRWSAVTRPSARPRTGSGRTSPSARVSGDTPEDYWGTALMLLP